METNVMLPSLQDPDAHLVDHLVDKCVRLSYGVRAECWNSGSGKTGLIPAGFIIYVEGIRYQYPWAHVVTASIASTFNEQLVGRVHLGGIEIEDGSMGYRFIVPDLLLQTAYDPLWIQDQPRKRMRLLEI